MRPGMRTAAATLAAATAATAVGVIGATAPVVASADTPPAAVTVTLAGHGITMEPGSTLPAGKVYFVVKAPKGEHTLQLARLHTGYTQKQAKHDVDAAFSGNVKAVRRVDKNVDWLGGDDATPGHPGKFAVDLTPGAYLATDQDSPAIMDFDVVASPSSYRTLYPSSFVTTKNNRFHTHTDLALPHAGWMKFHNNAVEPHMFVFQHVQQSTTKQDVRDYVASGSQKPPSWGLREATDAGVISPGTTEVFHYSLPAGKYLVACFWPSKQNGMPHFAMGMWKLVELS
jgi:hypothetical protein